MPMAGSRFPESMDTLALSAELSEEFEAWAAGAGYEVFRERFLTAQLGIALRSHRGLPRVLFPFQPEDAAPGFRFQQLDQGWATLVRTDGKPIDATFADTSMHPAVRFSYFADADPADIRRSFADPPGSPLFAPTLETSRGIKGFLDREVFG